MKSLPCPRCGREEVVGTFCLECQRALHPLIERIKEQTIRFCVVSKKAKVSNAWEDISSEEAFLRAAKKALVPSIETTIEDVKVDAPDIIEFLDKPGINREVEVLVTVRGYRTPVKEAYEEEYAIPITIETTTSKQYSKIGTQYFEGTLQVRNETPDRKKVMEELFRKHEVIVNKTSAVGTGSDYQVTDKQRMRHAAHDLHARFGGLLKQNARLITRDKQRSKDVHRLTVLLEYPPYERGAVVTDDERLLIVTKTGKKIQYRNLCTGKRVEESYESEKMRVLEPIKARVVRGGEEPVILDPHTYQEERLYAPRPLEDDGEVAVVEFKGRWWLASA